MIESDESRVAVFRVKVWPITRKNVCVEIYFHGRAIVKCAASPVTLASRSESTIHLRVEIWPARARQNVWLNFHGVGGSSSPLLDAILSAAAATKKIARRSGRSTSKRLYRLGLRDLLPALLAGAPCIVVPKIAHRLTEVLNDVAAVEINVFHQRPAIVAVKDDMFVLTRRPPTLDYHSQRVRRPDRRVRDIRRNKERLPFTHEMIDDAIAFANAHLDVPLELVKILFRVDQMKIVPSVGAFDDHHEKVAPVIEILVAHGRLKLFPVLFDPVF